MSRSVRLIAVVAWFVVGLAGTALIVARAYVDAHDRLFQDSSIALRLLSEKGAQHVAVLTTLGAASLRDMPPSLYAGLRERMPQLTGIAYWRIGSGWYAAAGPLPPARPPAGRSREIALEFDGASAYWMFTDAPWAIRVDPYRMLSAGDWPASLSSAEVQLQGRRFALLHRPPEALPVIWTLRIEKRLPVVPQAFVLRTTRVVTLADLPWLPISLWNIVVLLAGLAGLGGWRLRLAQARERTRARLDRFASLDTFGEMTAGLAHELNQPLMAIVSHVRAAERLLDTASERENVRAALRTGVAQAKRAARILERLRSAVSSASRHAPQAVDPAATVLALLSLCHDEPSRSTVRLEWCDTAPGARPLADQVALEQILHNLIQNACDAVTAGAQARIVVIGERVEQCYRFRIVDNGAGIDDAALPKIFDPFFTTRTHGLGLGLPLCETLTRRQNGSLTIRNLPSGGAEAMLCLPLAEDVA
ncbi:MULTISPECIES: ATP-binding protein [unclassified Burkholderia]|uniref:sensor histidine kinase n=1 Tax=unclassified Burkholderia TaxID=2613784 RepID=UPI00141D9138|nr:MULTISPECIES: ATP-binding protein [unclassified Burkholderia]NIE84123.1 two-component sensor histidine kinase [Burkholderia sp. Tr-860]NIF63790.1 two-component sensor histidine kinase [Burkholderia sp. Cy-647]NIF71044.1 two-component sensor histidine kinase [Burkholderia sp. Ap-962]NIF98412.1 two-component sensor histidine kinase [Burkholderia sp. Ax-1720]